MDKPVLILWTCKNREEARQIAQLLLHKRLVACASLFPQIESYFHWEGVIELSQECQVFLKTMHRQFEAVRDCILTHCSYQVPEIVQLEIQEGNPVYLDWINDTVI
jgi:periplasmic divalent cation tolerance protein